MIELLSRINSILWKDWDPIGAGVPEDEYASYANWIYIKHMSKEFTHDTLVKYLLSVETDSIGLKPRPERAEVIARKLFDLFNETTDQNDNR